MTTPVHLDLEHSREPQHDRHPDEHRRVVRHLGRLNRPDNPSQPSAAGVGESLGRRECHSDNDGADDDHERPSLKVENHEVAAPPPGCRQPKRADEALRI